MNENPAAVAQQRWVAGEKSGGTGKHLPFRYLLPAIIAAAVFLIVALAAVSGYIEKWLWMRQLGYTGIFWTLLSVRWAMVCSAFIFAFLFLWINLRQAARNASASSGSGRAGWPTFLSRTGAIAQPGIDFSPGLLELAVVLFSAGEACLETLTDESRAM
jgi:hypothetical protein